MYCTLRSLWSGASTSPPAAIRRGQYVKRSVGSCGPEIKPGRTFNTLPGIITSAARSHSALSPPVSLPRNLLDRRVWELPHRRLFVGPWRDGLGVNGDAGDEGVMVDRTSK